MEHHPHGALRLLLGARGWQYETALIRSDLLDALEQFQAVFQVPPLPAALGAWLFLGEHRTRKQIYYGPRAFGDLMMWWGILADAGLDLGVWVDGRSISWEFVARTIKLARAALIRQWVTAARPLVSALFGESPRTEKEMIMQVIAHERAWRRTLKVRSPKALKRVRDREVTGRMFRILNRRMHATFSTQSGEVERWNKILDGDTSEKAISAKKEIQEDHDRAQKTGNPLDYLGQ